MLDTFRDRLPTGIPPLAIPIAAAVILLLVVFLLVVPNCSGSSQSESQQSASAESSSASAPAADSGENNGVASSSSSASASASSSASSASAETVTPDTSVDRQEELVNLIGEDATGKLLTQARTNTQALWIAAHPDRYAFDGIEVQLKVLKLAADEPAAIPYVREFPSQYPSADVRDDGSVAMDTRSPSSDVPDTKVPHLYQWDRRWGNTVYSSTALGLTGCGPTSLAMVYQGVTGKSDLSPHDLAAIAEDRGYMSTYEGTDSSFLTDMAGELGMYCETPYPTSDSIVSALEGGAVIIANLGPGQFTEHGHFFVLAGLADDGKVIINDPYSATRSSQTWDCELIASEAVELFAYSLKEA